MAHAHVSPDPLDPPDPPDPAGSYAPSADVLVSAHPDAGWRHARVTPSLAEAYRTVPVTGRSWWRKMLAFAGPGYLVAVGYMDPGNWATSLAGGAKYGYALLAVALISNLMAIVLQALCARLAVATGRDLAQACRDAYPRPVAWVL